MPTSLVLPLVLRIFKSCNYHCLEVISHWQAEKYHLEQIGFMAVIELTKLKRPFYKYQKN